MAIAPCWAKGRHGAFTDSQPLRDFFSGRSSWRAMRYVGVSPMTCAMFPEEPWSGYENKLVAQGATRYMASRPRAAPWPPDPEHRADCSVEPSQLFA